MSMRSTSTGPNRLPRRDINGVVAESAALKAADCPVKTFLNATLPYPFPRAAVPDTS